MVGGEDLEMVIVPFNRSLPLEVEARGGGGLSKFLAYLLDAFQGCFEIVVLIFFRKEEEVGGLEA